MGVFILDTCAVNKHHCRFGVQMVRPIDEAVHLVGIVERQLSWPTGQDI